MHCNEAKSLLLVDVIFRLLGGSYIGSYRVSRDRNFFVMQTFQYRRRGVVTRCTLYVCPSVPDRVLTQERNILEGLKSLTLHVSRVTGGLVLLLSPKGTQVTRSLKCCAAIWTCEAK